MSQELPSAWRIMHLVIMFDLPVMEPQQRKRYTKFRKKLLDDGFYMVQYSIYAKIFNGSAAIDTAIERVKGYAPPEGTIHALRITDKQMSDSVIIMDAGRSEMPSMEQFLLI